MAGWERSFAKAEVAVWNGAKDENGTQTSYCRLVYLNACVFVQGDTEYIKTAQALSRNLPNSSVVPIHKLDNLPPGAAPLKSV